MKSQKIKVGVETVQNYLLLFCNAYVLHNVPRYDIKGKRFLEFNEKYFLNDIGLHDAILGVNQNNISGILENIIYLELLYRGYTVSIDREFSALEDIKDHEQKIVLSLDKFFNIERNGIKHQNIIDFLTKK